MSQKTSVKWWSNQSLNLRKQFDKSKLESESDQPQETFSVEIWGKAAIGSVFVIKKISNKGHLFDISF